MHAGSVWTDPLGGSSRLNSLGRAYEPTRKKVAVRLVMGAPDPPPIALHFARFCGSRGALRGASGEHEPAPLLFVRRLRPP
jgi:hypothetical protein